MGMHHSISTILVRIGAPQKGRREVRTPSTRYRAPFLSIASASRSSAPTDLNYGAAARESKIIGCLREVGTDALPFPPALFRKTLSVISLDRVCDDVSCLVRQRIDAFVPRSASEPESLLGVRQ